MFADVASASDIRSPRPFRALLLLLPLLTLTVAPAQGGSAPGRHERLCRELAQRQETMPKPIEQRKLDFLLLDAAERGCTDLASKLLADGASVHARNAGGNTPLLRAAGAEIDRSNLAGTTPLLAAVKARRRRTARVLLEAGADPNRTDRGGVTPLMAAAFNGDRRTVTELLKAGAEPDAVDRYGKSAIIYAAGRGYARIVKALIEAGVDPKHTYGHDLTALMWAAGHANDVPETDGLEVIKALLAAGAPVGAADDRGRTALMIAAERGHAAAVRLLLAAGAEPGRRDRQGRTAADLAANDKVRAALAR